MKAHRLRVHVESVGPECRGWRLVRTLILQNAALIVLLAGSFFWYSRVLVRARPLARRVRLGWKVHRPVQIFTPGSHRVLM